MSLFNNAMTYLGAATIMFLADPLLADDYDFALPGITGSSPGSCVGFCGGQSPDGCWCDNSCMEFGDCCTDYCHAWVCGDSDPACPSFTYLDPSSWSPAGVPGRGDSITFQNSALESYPCLIGDFLGGEYQVDRVNVFTDDVTWFGGYWHFTLPIWVSSQRILDIEQELYVFTPNSGLTLNHMVVNTPLAQVEFGGEIRVSSSSALNCDLLLWTPFTAPGLDAPLGIGSEEIRASGPTASITADVARIASKDEAELVIEDGANTTIDQVEVPYLFGNGFNSPTKRGTFIVQSGGSADIGSLNVATLSNDYHEGNCLFTGTDTEVNLSTTGMSTVGVNDLFGTDHFARVSIRDNALVRTHGQFDVNITGEILIDTGGTLELLPGSALTNYGLIDRPSGGVILPRAGSLLTVDHGGPDLGPGRLEMTGSFDFGYDDHPDHAVVVFQNGGNAQIQYGWRYPKTPEAKATTVIAGVGQFGPSRIFGTGGGAGADLRVGEVGFGELHVSGGGWASFFDDFIVGDQPTGDGLAVVSGTATPSSWRSNVELYGNSSDIIVGGEVATGGAKGTLHVLDGAIVSAMRHFFLARRSGSEASVHVEGMEGGHRAEIIVGAALRVGGTGTTHGGTATLDIFDGGRVEIGGGARIYSDGDVAVKHTGSFTPRLEVGGEFRIWGGRLILDEGIVQVCGDVFENDGQIRGSGYIIDCSSVVAGSGGSATFINSGELVPRSPEPPLPSDDGVIRISGRDLELLPNAVLDIEIDSNNVVLPHLYVDGGVSLGGTLVVNFAPDFVPEKSQEVLLIDATGIVSGVFDDIVAPDGSQVSYRNGSVVIVPGDDCFGDLNSDNLINVGDLLLLLGAWGSNPGHPADLNDDGVISVTDLLLLLGVWGPCPG